MHGSAMQNCKAFYDCYASHFNDAPVRVIEIGSQNVNGTIRDVCPSNVEYIGVDFVAAEGVDVVLEDPYVLPFDDHYANIIVSSSCFEHSEMFWLLFLDIMRVLKSKGLFYLNVPSNGSFHRYPVDCWRFYPDSGRALDRWARYNKLDSVLLESYVSEQTDSEWNDFVSVYLKDEKYVSDFPSRIIDTKKDFMNGMIYGSDVLLQKRNTNQDMTKLILIDMIIKNKLKIN
jgi:SAM-dependent methyltransferase